MKVYLLYRHERHEGVIGVYRIFSTLLKAQKHAEGFWKFEHKSGNMQPLLEWRNTYDGQFEARCTSDGRQKFIILEREVL